MVHVGTTHGLWGSSQNSVLDISYELLFVPWLPDEPETWTDRILVHRFDT